MIKIIVFSSLRPLSRTVFRGENVSVPGDPAHPPVAAGQPGTLKISAMPGIPIGSQESI
jgi:hypothetical protein